MPLIASGELTRRVTEALAGGHGPISAGPGRERAAAQPGAGPHAWLTSPVEDVLTRRHAVRHFASHPMTGRQLCAIVEGARAAERTQWPRESRGDGRITMVIAALRVTGLTEGLYVAAGDQPAAGSFVPLPSGTETLARLRADYADAAVLLLLCANLRKACLPDAPGYGALLVRCGSVGYAAWLKAVDENLAGCAYGAAHQLVTDALGAYDAELRHLFTVSAGPPQPASLVTGSHG